jgi:hypothetical protein
MSEGEIALRPKVEDLTRLFSPNEVNLDDLAEAIRSLLEPAGQPQIGLAIRPKPDLLSFPLRGPHVVETTGTP